MQTITELKLQYSALMAYIRSAMAEMTNLDSNLSFNQWRRMKEAVECKQQEFKNLMDDLERENFELRLENERLKKFRDIVRLENEKEILCKKIEAIKKSIV